MPDRALGGLTVVECNRTGAAAYATKLMADLGADVIKVENPGGGDLDRTLGPFPGGDAHPEKSGTFLYLNCNKQSVALDITVDSGRRAFVRSRDSTSNGGRSWMKTSVSFSRWFFVAKEHPEVGVRKHAGIPWRLSETPCEVWRAAPVMGQDNDYVFGELLGMSSPRIAELTERQVVY